MRNPAIGNSVRSGPPTEEGTAVSFSLIVGTDLSGQGCPSTLQIALFESGNLGITAAHGVAGHAQQCARCESSLRQLREARVELFGDTAAQSDAARRSAAAAIENALRRFVH